MFLTMMVNGRRVVIRESLRPGYHLLVDGAYWGAFDSPEVACRAAVCVLCPNVTQ